MMNKFINSMLDSAQMRIGHKKRDRKSGWALLVLSIVFLFGSGACTFDTLEYTPVETPDSVSFLNDIIPIFEANCAKAGCHAAGGISPNLSASTAYSSLSSNGLIDETDTVAENSILYEEITTGGMVQYATDQDRTLVRIWIEQGAKNN